MACAEARPALRINQSPDVLTAANNARLFARRDLPRSHAELIDVPIADDHLDRGCCFVTATHSLRVALSFGSQPGKLKLNYVVVVNHGPIPLTMQGSQLFLQTWRRMGVLLARSGQCTTTKPPPS